MTKKPIIINDVDVSECEHYDEACLGNHHYKWCKDNKDCYYKQLKRKEQEYNRLSSLITSTKAYEITCSNCRDAILTAPTISGRTKFSQIEVEESSLKKIIEQLKNKEQECEEWKKDYATAKGMYDLCQSDFMELAKIKDNYKQALQEAKADLTKQLDELKEAFNNAIELSKIYKKQIFKSSEKALKYSQALHEIKKIAEDDCKTCTVKLLGEDKINCKRCYKTKILQKCEVLDD